MSTVASVGSSALPWTSASPAPCVRLLMAPEADAATTRPVSSCSKWPLKWISILITPSSVAICTIAIRAVATGSSPASMTPFRARMICATSAIVLEAVWKQSLYMRRDYVIYRARLRTHLLDNRSLDMLLEISKRLIYWTLVSGQPLRCHIPRPGERYEGDVGRVDHHFQPI